MILICSRRKYSFCAASIFSRISCWNALAEREQIVLFGQSLDDEVESLADIRGLEHFLLALQLAHEVARTKVSKLTGLVEVERRRDELFAKMRGAIDDPLDQGLQIADSELLSARRPQGTS